MKKPVVKNKNNDIRARNERLTDKAVLLSALIILYGILILFLQSMGYNSLTVSGAVTFVRILFWGSIVGAMIFAALAVYRERRELMLYSGIFIYILWTTTVLLRTGNWNYAFTIVYISLVAAFILVHVNIWLRKSGRFEKLAPRVIFVIVAALVLAALSLVSLSLRIGIMQNMYYNITSML